MESGSKKQPPVRITYKFVKTDNSAKKNQEESNLHPTEFIAPSEGDADSVVSPKQKRVLVAFLEEQGKGGVMGEGEVEGLEGGMWREVAVMLNSARVGGCVKAPHQWRKYWLNLMQKTKDSVNELREKSSNFKLDSLPLLTRKIYQLATGQGGEEEGSTLEKEGGALVSELVGQVQCKDVAQCERLIERVTSNETDFDAVYLEEGGESTLEQEDDNSPDEGNIIKQKNNEAVKNNFKRRKRSANATQEAKIFNSKYQSTINFLRLKQERLKVMLLQKEIEAQSQEVEQRRQLHEVEMKRRQMELVHMDAMHNKILHMTNM